MRIEMPLNEFFKKSGLNKACKIASRRIHSTHDEVDFSDITFSVVREDEYDQNKRYD